MLWPHLSEEQALLLASAVEEARLCDRLLRHSGADIDRLAVGFRTLVNLLLAIGTAAEEPQKEGAASPK